MFFGGRRGGGCNAVRSSRNTSMVDLQIPQSLLVTDFSLGISIMHSIGKHSGRDRSKPLGQSLMLVVR